MPAERRKILAIACCVYAVSTLISMAVMSIGAGLLAAALLWAFGGPLPLARAIRSGLRSSFGDRGYLAVSAALALACVASLAAASVFPVYVGQLYSQVHVFQDSLKLWYLAWPLVIVAGLRALEPAERERVLACWTGAAFVLGFVAIVQHFTGWPRPQMIPTGLLPHRYHATLFLGHHLSVASILIFPFFASLDFTRRPFKWPRASWVAIAALGFITLILTYSRTLWMALPLTLIVWAFFNFPRRWFYTLAALMAVAVGLSTQIPSVKARFTHVSFLEGVGDREDLWMANLHFLELRPVLGVGWKHNQELSGYYLMEKYPGKSVFSGHAHNNILDMLGGTGLVGALSWLAWSLFALWLAYRAMIKRVPGAFASGLLCAWLAFQINGLTQVNFWDAKVTHQVAWMVAWSLLWF